MQMCKVINHDISMPSSVKYIQYFQNVILITYIYIIFLSYFCIIFHQSFSTVTYIIKLVFCDIGITWKDTQNILTII